MSEILFQNIKTAAHITDAVICLFSGGKDSVVTLDICHRYFKKIYPVFMYLVPDLSFHNAMIRWVKSRYSYDVQILPHFMISGWLRYGTLREIDLEVPIIKTVDVYNYIREQTGCYWIVGGERISDSIVRRAMIKNSGTIDDKRGRIYPVAYWSKPEILRYIKRKKLKISPESKYLGHSFRSLMPKEMYLMKKYYPKDYDKIKSWFPYIEASTKQYEFFYEKN